MKNKKVSSSDENLGAYVQLSFRAVYIWDVHIQNWVIIQT